MKKLLLFFVLVIAGKFSAAQCQAMFSFIVQSTNPAIVVFSDSSFSSSTINSWFWTMGDGTNQNTSNFQHMYSSPGTYNVCLTIVDALGCSDTVCMSVTIGTSAPSVTLYHLMPDSTSMYHCTSPASVAYYFSGFAPNYASSDSITFLVSFGDGVDSTFKLSAANIQFYGTITHEYLNGGTYTAQLIATGPDFQADTIQSLPIIVASSCGNISGTVYEDNNANCVYDGGDVLLSGISVQLTSSGQPVAWTTTDVNGVYYFNVPTSVAYEITVHPSNTFNLHYAPSCPSNGIINVPGAPSSGNDFALICPPGYDFTGHVSGWNFRPGFTANVCVSAYNRLCNTPSGQIELVFPSFATPQSDTSSTGYIVNGNTVTLQVNSPDLYWQFCIPVYIATTAQIGDSICIDMSITPTVNDSAPADNNETFCFLIRGSYDPNDKNVSPAGDGPLGNVRPGADFTYTIRFQNTGNAEAINVFILDTLDADLDVSSIEVLGASHAMHWSILSGNILRFNFDNIMLPDSNSNEPASHGYVTYRMKHISGIAHLAEISNTAGIYFDFNPPIITNTVINTIDFFLSIEGKENRSSINLFPNPVNNELVIDLSSIKESGYLQIFTPDSKLILSERFTSATLHPLNVKSLPAGVYFIRINSNTSTQTLRFVKK